MSKTIRTFCTGLLAALVLTVAISSCKSKPNDEAIKTAVTTALASYPGISADVKDGVVTITGEAADPAAKTAINEALKAVAGVKSVADNTTVTPPPPPVETSTNDAITTGLTDALKDFPGVTGSVNADGKIALTGEIAKAKWNVLKQALDKLMGKGYELSGLKIK